MFQSWTKVIKSFKEIFLLEVHTITDWTVVSSPSMWITTQKQQVVI